jgi:hypothetical protein
LSIRANAIGSGKNRMIFIELMINVFLRTPRNDGELNSSLKCLSPTHWLWPTMRKSWKARTMPAIGTKWYTEK